MRGLRAWFDARTLRERRLILVMLALMALTLAWGAVIRPLGDGLASARERHRDAVLRLAGVEARVDAVRAAVRDAGTGSPGPLADAVRLGADRAGLALATLDPDGADRVRVTVASARAGALVGWLARLEENGVLVDRAQLTPNGDRTMGAQLTLRARRP